MIKDIVVNLKHDVSRDRARFAITVAKAFDAGGYGHPKLREIILGGVTRAMLKSMTVPVFMSH